VPLPWTVEDRQSTGSFCRGPSFSMVIAMRVYGQVKPCAQCAFSDLFGAENLLSHQLWFELIPLGLVL
jgi:hypothetical protein